MMMMLMTMLMMMTIIIIIIIIIGALQPVEPQKYKRVVQDFVLYTDAEFQFLLHTCCKNITLSGAYLIHTTFQKLTFPLSSG